jgi:DNA-binding transcriptional LysR family regulator
MGIAALAPSLCREAIGDGRLTPVLADWTVPRLGVYAVTTSRLQSAIVRAFVDFVADRFAALWGMTTNDWSRATGLNVP